MTIATKRAYANAYADRILASEPLTNSGNPERTQNKISSEFGLVFAIVGFLIGFGLPFYLKDLIGLQDQYSRASVVIDYVGDSADRLFHIKRVFSGGIPDLAGVQL